MSDSPNRCSISLQSFSSALIITPKSSIPSGQSTDEFELIVDSDVEVDDDRGDEEDYDGESNSMSSASVSPSIYAHEFEHCRRYHSYKSGRYPLPNDTPEQRREETLHYLALEMNEGHVFLSGVTEWPQKIIDIGTGIGSWAIEVADMYPGASVKGTDLSPIQPNWLPVNLRMFVEDCEGEWLHGSGFDLIHMRDVIGTLRDIPSMLEKILNNLAPGGWVELQDIETSIYCDDMTMSPNDALNTFFKFATKGIQSFGLTSYPLLPSTLTPLLSQTGFTNIQVITKKIPIAPWARDPNLAAAGVLAKEWVSETIDAMAAKPLAILDMAVKDRKDLAGQAKRSLEKEGVHRYLRMHVVLAQREREMSVMSDSESYMSSGSA